MEHVFWDDDAEEDYCIGTRAGGDGKGDGKVFRVSTNCRKTITEFRKNAEGVVLKTTTTINVSKVTEEADDEGSDMEESGSPLKGSQRCAEQASNSMPDTKPPPRPRSHPYLLKNSLPPENHAFMAGLKETLELKLKERMERMERRMMADSQTSPRAASRHAAVTPSPSSEAARPPTPPASDAAGTLTMNPTPMNPRARARTAQPANLSSGHFVSGKCGPKPMAASHLGITGECSESEWIRLFEPTYKEI